MFAAFMRRILIALAAVTLLAPATVFAERQQIDALSLEVPDGWETKTRFMGLALFARPTQQSDAQGWSQDHLSVARQKGVKQTLTLDSASEEKLQQMRHHASQFALLSSKDLTIGTHTVRRLEVRYTEGLRNLHGLLTLVPENTREYSTVITVTDESRFEQQRPLFKQVHDSIRIGRPGAKN